LGELYRKAVDGDVSWENQIASIKQALDFRASIRNLDEYEKMYVTYFVIWGGKRYPSGEMCTFGVALANYITQELARAS
jgi:hypothetical protein